MLAKSIKQKKRIEKKRIEKNRVEWRIKEDVKQRAKEAFKSFCFTTMLNLFFGSVLATIVLFVINLGR